VDIKEMGLEATKWINMVQGREKRLVLLKVLTDFILSIPWIIINFMKL
jgi:hypothetical protein